jgi:hypothetical protein
VCSIAYTVPLFSKAALFFLLRYERRRYRCSVFTLSQSSGSAEIHRQIVCVYEWEAPHLPPPLPVIYSLLSLSLADRIFRGNLGCFLSSNVESAFHCSRQVGIGNYGKWCSVVSKSSSPGGTNRTKISHKDLYLTKFRSVSLWDLTPSV